MAEKKKGHAFWIMIAALLCAAGAYAASSYLVQGFTRTGLNAWGGWIMQALLYIFFTLGLLAFVIRVIVKRTMTSFRIPWIRFEERWFILGLVIPLAVTGLFMLFPGKWSINDMDGMQALTLACSAILFHGFAVPLCDGMVYYGVILKVLDERTKGWAAVLITALLWAVSRVAMVPYDPWVWGLTGGTALLGGILMALTVKRCGTIYSAVALQGFWNIFFHLVYTGSAKPEGYLYSYALRVQNPLISGSTAGAYGSLLSAWVFALFAVIELFMLLKPEKKKPERPAPKKKAKKAKGKKKEAARPEEKKEESAAVTRPEEKKEEPEAPEPKAEEKKETEEPKESKPEEKKEEEKDPETLREEKKQEKLEEWFFEV